MDSDFRYNLLKLSRRFKSAFHRDEEYVKELNRIGMEFSEEVSSATIKNNITILMTSFSIYPPCFVHDKVFSYALRLRNAQIIPLYCDAVQSTECNVCGGVWSEGSFNDCCYHCRKRSELLWQNNPIKPLPLSQFISKDDFDRSDRIIRSLDKTWYDYEDKGFSFGRWAKDILVNNYTVADYHLIPNHDFLGKSHIRNLLVLKAGYQNIINETNPNRVISNDSYYGMWAILQKICEQKHIPFYSHWIGGRPDGWCYAYKDSAMNLAFSVPWPSFVNIPLSEHQIRKVKNWIESRSTGKGMILDTASLQSFNTDDFNFSKIDPKKPIALMPCNVIWDLAALNKQLIFSDMIDWIIQTMQWFTDHPEYQLIIKPHPGELHPSIPETKERVEIAIQQRGITVPENVFLLTPRVKCTVYDLFPISKVGIVNTTTVGIEMAAQGIPVITTGKSPYRGFGFTLDPPSPKEYFEFLTRIFSGDEIIEREKQIENAYKFILFYQFHYYSRINIMEYSWGKSPQLKINSLEDLLPGKNKCLDYFVDSVIQGIPILTADRWPPES